jgi:hypothetical protein
MSGGKSQASLISSNAFSTVSGGVSTGNNNTPAGATTPKARATSRRDATETPTAPNTVNDESIDLEAESSDSEEEEQEQDNESDSDEAEQEQDENENENENERVDLSEEFENMSVTRKINRSQGITQ